MTAFIKRNIFILVSSLTVLVLTASFLFLNSAKDNGSLYMKNISGDESVLQGLEISGILHDSYCGVAFNFKEGKSDQKFMYYNNIQDYFKNISFYKNYSTDRLTTQNAEYNITGNSAFSGSAANLISITKRVNGQLQYKYIECDVRNYSNSGYLFFGYSTCIMEEINNKLYFVIPTDENSRGKSGIYEISQFDNYSYYNKDASGYRKLVDIDLEDGKIQVKGMYAVGDSLCVILIQSNKMILKAFSLSTERFSTPLEMPLPDNIESSSDLRIDGGYAHGEHLSISMYRNGKLGVDTFLISDDTISLISSIDAGDMPKRHDKKDMIYKNHMLYIIAEAVYFPNPEETGYFGQDPEYYLDLIVYASKGNLKYTGRLETDINDDNIWQLKFNRYIDMQGRSYDHRRYEQIELR